MKMIYSLIIIIGSILHQCTSLPIYSNHNTNHESSNLDPAIVVTRPHKPIITPESNNTGLIYEKENTTNPIILSEDQSQTITADDIIMPAKLILPSGEIIYTPQDIKPFIISPFSDLEPVIINPVIE